jgi:predicted nucleic acid-binding protein
VEEAMQAAGGGPVRLSPVVASERLRGASGPAVPRVEELARRLVAIEPRSWRRCWIDVSRLLPRVFPHHEEVGPTRLQNDPLLALTARHTGTLLVTRDAHFEALRAVSDVSLLEVCLKWQARKIVLPEPPCSSAGPARDGRLDRRGVAHVHVMYTETAMRTTAVRHKHLKLDQGKIDFAKRYFGVDSEQEAIERALGLLMDEERIVRRLKPLRGILKGDERPWPYR